MAKKIKTITEEEQVVESPPIEVLSGLEADQETSPVDEDLESFLTGYQEDEPQIKIYKYNSLGKAVYCNEVSNEMASEQYIQSHWGEGKYRVRLYKEGKYLASKNIWIGPPADVPVEQKENPPTPQLGGDMVTQMILGELNANRQMMQMMIEKMGNGNKQSSFIELAQAMEMLKTVITPAPSPGPANVISEMVGILKQGIEIGAAGGGTDKSGWMGIIKDVAQAIPQVLSSLPGRATQPAIAPEPGGAPRPAPVANPGVPMPLRLAIAFLKTKAAKGSDPSVYVDVAMDNLDDPRWASLIELADKPYEEIAQALDPELLDPVYRPWFEELLKGLRDAIHGGGVAGGSDLDNANPPKDEGFSA